MTCDINGITNRYHQAEDANETTAMLSRASRLVLTGAFLEIHQSGAFRPLRLRGISSSAITFRPSRHHAVVDIEYDNNQDALLLTNDTIIHLNHAGASPSPLCVLDTVIQHLELEQRLGGYSAAEQRHDDLVQVYQDVANLIHASSPNEIALVESATVAWTRVFYSMVEQHEDIRTHPNGKRRVILMSEAEYAANVVAASQWARTHDDWTVLPIPSSTNSDGSSTGIVDINVFQSMLEGSHNLIDPDDIALVCVTHVPTNSGIVNPVEQMGRLIEEYNKNKDTRHESKVFFLVDACQSVGQMDVNVQDMKCHGLAATGRKFLRAPRGTGFLYVREDIVDSLTPSHLDHACAPITQVPSTAYPPANIEDWIDITFQPGAKRFEFWESNVAGKLGLGQAAQYAMNEMGLDHISSCCRLVAEELVALLNEMDDIDLHHESSCGIVTFTVRGIDSATVKDQLWTKQTGDDCRFEVSVVPATSTPLDSAQCRVPDLVRASVSYTTSLQDVERFVTRLQTIIKDQQ